MRTKKKVFVTVNEFVEEFGVSKNHLYVSIHKKEIPDEHINKRYRPLTINKNYLISIANFKRNLKIRCQDRYYEMFEYFKKDSLIVKKLQSIIGRAYVNWESFVYVHLFDTYEPTILATRVSRVQLKFLYLSGKILREIRT